MNSHRISRRTLLKGAGVSLALPWLEAMSVGRAWGAGEVASPPIRFAGLYMANGALMDAWTPSGIGRDFTLSPTLEPLGPLRDEVLVLSNLWHRAANGGGWWFSDGRVWLRKS